MESSQKYILIKIQKALDCTAGNIGASLKVGKRGQAARRYDLLLQLF